MNTLTKPKSVDALELAERQLHHLANMAHTEIGLLSRVFAQLASQVNAMMDLSAKVVDSIDHDKIDWTLKQAQSLGAVAKRFVNERLESTAQILQIVSSEAQLLERLYGLAWAQKKIARETDTLSVLTNIEVARLGEAGADFQYLASELADFSRFVAADNKQMMSHVDNRKAAIDAAKRKLAVELPRMHQEFMQIDSDLASAMTVVESSLQQLSAIPLRFGSCLTEIDGQVSGIVAAVQAEDITRQQIEHVQEALIWICRPLSEGAEQGWISEPDVLKIGAGLAIQIYQLRMVKETVSNWAEQIKVCMSGILTISSSDLVSVGPLVLAQERELTAQLARVAQIKLDCHSHNALLEYTLGGLTSLTQLVTEHLQRATSVRSRLRLLTFNSIIEASRLGRQADAILTISHSIKQISANWNSITDQSAETMIEITSLSHRTKDVIATFSQGLSEELEQAQQQTRAGLDDLRLVVSCATEHAGQMGEITDKLHDQVALAGPVNKLFNGCLSSVTSILKDIVEVHERFVCANPKPSQPVDDSAMEQIYAVSYTTEMEREVLRAALRGAPLPAIDEGLSGNEVELF